MASHDVVLTKREAVARDTYAFSFEKPAGFEFTAGQSVSLVLHEPPPEPNNVRRTFSLVSAPFEAALTIATRVRSASPFKQALLALPLGSAVKLVGPRGTFTLHDDTSRGAVFIAGGIGITPFMSMLRQSLHDRTPRRFSILYSNRSTEEAAFLAELRSFARTHENVRLNAHMTATAGRIDDETIKRFAAEARAPIYYLVGSPAMVETISEALARIGVAQDDIRSESFFGY